MEQFTDGIIPVSGDARKDIVMPEIKAIIGLGEGDEGTISSAHLPKEVLEGAIEATTDVRFQKAPTNRWRCVDGRTPEGGVQTREGYSDPQLAGGLVVNEVSADIMTGTADSTLSATVARNTRTALTNGQQVVVHGDNHVHADEHGNTPETNKAGCGANKFQRYVLHKNAENAEVIAPIVFAASELAGLDTLWQNPEQLKDEIYTLIQRGKEVADNDSFWDIGPEGVVDVIVANGGEYEELIEDHLEVFAAMELQSDSTFDEESFMQAHEYEGKPLEAFIASVGLYAKYTFEQAEKNGVNKQEAAKRVLATVLAHVGTLKKLTNNIPVVITQ